MENDDILDRLNDIVDDLVGNTHLDYEGVNSPQNIPEMAFSVMNSKSMNLLETLIKELTKVETKLSATIKTLKIEQRRRQLMTRSTK